MGLVLCLLLLPLASTLGLRLYEAQEVLQIFGNDIADVDSYVIGDSEVPPWDYVDLTRPTLDQPEVQQKTDDERILDGGISIHTPDPPPHNQAAKMSRYLCHYSDWLAMATISTRGNLTGSPFASVFSYSDGPLGKSSGTPYFYLTGMDMSAHDLKKNANASVTISLAQGLYCKLHNLDPEDPRCSHVILAGEVVAVPPNTHEENFAKEALFSRHPAMLDWPADHGWYFGKLDIRNVILLDYFGGAIDVPLEKYFAAQP